MIINDPGLFMEGAFRSCGYPYSLFMGSPGATKSFPTTMDGRWMIMWHA